MSSAAPTDSTSRPQVDSDVKLRLQLARKLIAKLRPTRQVPVCHSSAGALICIGVFGILARPNSIAMLMSIELMDNAVNHTNLAFGAYIPALTTHASVIALVVMAVAAAEATVGLAIVIAIFRNRRTPLVDEYAAMSE